jgi:hypothetical protein
MGKIVRELEHGVLDVRHPYGALKGYLQLAIVEENCF